MYLFIVMNTKYLGNFLCRTYYLIWSEVTALEYELPCTNHISSKHTEALSKVTSLFIQPKLKLPIAFQCLSPQCLISAKT